MSSFPAGGHIFVEMLASGLLILGLAFLCAAGITYCISGFWVSARAVIYEAENGTGLRWHSTPNGICETLLPESHPATAAPGTELTIYYRPGRPADILLQRPYRPGPLAAAGTVMTACGAAASLAALFTLV